MTRNEGLFETPATPGTGLESAGVDRCQERRVTLLHQDAGVAAHFALLLGCLGARTQVVDNPAELELAVRSFQPDLVVVDAGLPLLRQPNAVRQFRQSADFANRKLVALTGWGRNAKQDPPSLAVFDAVLRRPVDLKSLEDLLASS